MEEQYRRPLEQIVEIIRQRCDRFANMVETDPELFYGPYSPHRKEHGLTHAVLSGFTGGMTSIEGLSCEEITYGKGMGQPELRLGPYVMHIYNETAGLSSDTIRAKCKQFNRPGSAVRFVVLQFSASTKDSSLRTVSLITFDSKGKKTSKETIWCRLTGLAWN